MFPGVVVKADAASHICLGSCTNACMLLMQVYNASAAQCSCVCQLHVLSSVLKTAAAVVTLLQQRHSSTSSTPYSPELTRVRTFTEQSSAPTSSLFNLLNRAAPTAFIVTSVTIVLIVAVCAAGYWRSISQPYAHLPC